MNERAKRSKRNVSQVVSSAKLAGAIVHCREQLPKELQAGDEELLKATLPTKDGGKVEFEAQSSSRIQEGDEAFIGHAYFISLKASAPQGSNAYSLSASKTSSGAAVANWSRETPKLAIAAGIQEGSSPPHVEVTPADAAKLSDPYDPNFVNCVRLQIMQEFSHVLGRVSTQTIFPEIPQPSLRPDCSNSTQGSAQP